jgi:hypothetical protein
MVINLDPFTIDKLADLSTPANCRRGNRGDLPASVNLTGW